MGRRTPQRMTGKLRETLCEVVVLEDDWAVASSQLSQQTLRRRGNHDDQTKAEQAKQLAVREGSMHEVRVGAGRGSGKSLLCPQLEHRSQRRARSARKNPCSAEQGF